MTECWNKTKKLVPWPLENRSLPVFKYNLHCDGVIRFELRSQVGVVIIIRASHLYDPRSTPGVRMWAEICPSLSDSESFSPGTPVILPPWRCASISCMVRIAEPGAPIYAFGPTLLSCAASVLWGGDERESFFFSFFFFSHERGHLMQNSYVAST